MLLWKNCTAFCSHSDDLAGGGTQLPPTPRGHDDQKLRSWTERKLWFQPGQSWNHVWNEWLIACRLRGIPEVELLKKKKTADSQSIEISYGRRCEPCLPDRLGTQLHRRLVASTTSSTCWGLEVDEEPDLQSRQVRRLKAEVPSGEKG